MSINILNTIPLLLSFQVLVDGLSEYFGCDTFCDRALPRSDRGAVHGAVCGVCQADRRGRGQASDVLYDGRQDRQNAGETGTLHGGGKEPGCRGMRTSVIILRDMYWSWKSRAFDLGL